jgi:hypothetical protein
VQYEIFRFLYRWERAAGVRWRGREVSASAVPGDTEGYEVQHDYRGVLGLGASLLAKQATSGRSG